jgi:hypothetical protein
MAPFVVFSLPRSRSTWLSVFLSSPDAPCGHDIGPTLDYPFQFAERLRSDLIGTCETGAAFAWRRIRAMLPDARFAVIRRDPLAVTRSLERFGIYGMEEEMWARAGHLEEIACEPDVLSVGFDELRRPEPCADLYRHLLGREMPHAWWAALDPVKIEVDMPRQLRMLASRYVQIEALKAMAREDMAHA